MGVFGTSKMKLFGGSEKIRKAYLGTEKIYSAGSIVTYYVDSNTYYQEEVDSDASCLNPTTFTPSKSGWTFVGWREDTVASGDVLSSKIMGDEPITLYAVYSQSVACNFVSYNKTETKYGTRYYNNGNTVNGSVTAPSGASYSGWSWRGWSHNNGTSATLSPRYANGATVSDISVTENHYGLYEQTIYLYYNGNGSTSGSVSTQSGTRYYNAYGNTSNPTFKLASNGYSRSNYTFTGWDLGAVGTNVTLSSSKTAYAQWVQTVTNYSYNGSVQSFTAPINGTYRLEVWGAQGGMNGNHSDYGGRGGYATGNIYLSSGTTLYICVGGGSDGWNFNYNGGGNYEAYGGYGGGATHIAKNTNRGVLSNYASYKSEVLIVAGGGGGSGLPEYEGGASEVSLSKAKGGSGGGTTGGSTYTTGGGTQSAGGNAGSSNMAYAGSFGQGGRSSGWWTGAGGGGWYGGSGAFVYGDYGTCGGGGGSGYIGGVSNGSMSNGVQSGSGKATVTFISAA